MGKAYKQQAKRLYGHPDYGPVLAPDTYVATATGDEVLAHTTLSTQVLPRDTQLLGIVCTLDDETTDGQLEYAVSTAGVVRASGQVPAGVGGDAKWVPLDRQNAVVASSGDVLEIAWSISANVGATRTVRLAVPVYYIGNV